MGQLTGGGHISFLSTAAAKDGSMSPTLHPTPWASREAQTPHPNLPGPAHLEEVDLHTAITEVQDDGAAGAEPGPQVGEPGQLVTFPRRDVGARLQQVLAHVVSEVLQEGDLVGG